MLDALLDELIGVFDPSKYGPESTLYTSGLSLLVSYKGGEYTVEITVDAGDTKLHIDATGRDTRLLIAQVLGQAVLYRQQVKQTPEGIPA